MLRKVIESCVEEVVFPAILKMSRIVAPFFFLFGERVSTN